MADFIIRLINENQRNQDVLREAMETLESVMQDGLNFSTEQAADAIVTRIKERFC